MNNRKIMFFFLSPYLIDQNRQFKNATSYSTAIKNGGIRVVDDKGCIVNTVERYKRILGI